MAEYQYINVLGKKVRYFKKGRGRPIVFVHGWGGTIESLKPLANLLAENFQSIVIELPGFGQSDPPDKDWGVEEYAQLVREIIQKLKLNQIIYFGHSFGGGLGIFLAAQQPSIIEKLILCNSSFKREVRRSRLAKFFRSTPRQIKLLIYKIFFPSSDLAKFPHLENNFRKIVVTDLTKYLPKIKSPTFILWGENDEITPLGLAYELKEKIRQSRLKIFSKEKHNLPLKSPQLVYNEVRKFL
ncbi:MAG: alpha/beta hydrolase [Microgenomates group bacterium]|nr:alpha/beta hydrolase [Microgenomates group bacterium]